ncbi:MAG TPA: hypothetical protein VE262_17175 [Blastocatellia bacterium]|nr:hypothetical protein [Blastocatellia bacterium]
MALDKKHSVKVKLQVLELSKAGSGIELDIYSEGEKLGTIEIGHGSFGWRPVNKKRFKRTDWSTFARFMQDVW